MSLKASKEKQLSASLNNPGAKEAQFNPQCVTSQMHHTDRIAYEYYRVSTKDVSKTAGKMVNAILVDNKKKPSGLEEPPRKKICLSESSEDDVEGA